MRVLVTGAAGFIGANYTRLLLSKDNIQVTAVDQLTYAADTNNLPMNDPNLTFIKADVRDPEMMRTVIPGHERTIHFAAETHVDRSINDPRIFFDTNIMGTETLLAACRDNNVGKVVLVSTDEVYGSIETGSWTEESPILPNSPYASSKAASELVALSYQRTFGMDVSVTRCSNNYGRFQDHSKLIPHFIKRLINDKPVPLYGDGSNQREWLHVSDHCRAIDLVADKGRSGQIYNIGGGNELTNRQLTDTLLQLLGKRSDLIEHVTDRLGHDRRYAIDDTKIKDELGYKPSVALADGLAETVDWYLRRWAS